MNRIEEGVSRLYASYDVLERIRAGLGAMNLDPDHISPDQLKSVDEFHIGGGEATKALLDDLDIKSSMSVLDIGSGIGGPVRMIAQRFNCRVTGVDLTPHFVETAKTLSKMCGMADRVDFVTGSATDLPFENGSFDLALLLHVGMNVPDKPAIFREARRVLRDKGMFAVYDVMRSGDGDLGFPVPWADTPEYSALERPQIYRDAAKAAGFTLVSERDKSAIALDFFARIQERTQGAAPPPLGLHNLMGPSVVQKTGNMISAIKAGIIAPTEMIFRANTN